MESFIRDLDKEATEHQKLDTKNYQSNLDKPARSTLSGDTTNDKAQTGMTGPSWTGGFGQGENKCHAGGPDHHPDEVDCDRCRKH
ncbi:unnamed protein product [Rotaria sordida]|uniref:Uncharacterized protein n=2 Tax=Rotaria sordida TaxID=392033 RepID=A0A819KJF6_9BILA|nr:unnamed protein product [Rotaria sordida]